MSGNSEELEERDSELARRTRMLGIRARSTEFRLAKRRHSGSDADVTPDAFGQVMEHYARHY